MKDVIVVKVLHFSHWASNKTRLNIDTGFDQLLWPYTLSFLGRKGVTHIPKVGFWLK